MGSGVIVRRKLQKCLFAGLAVGGDGRIIAGSGTLDGG
jgi:hypothetical protein